MRRESRPFTVENRQGQKRSLFFHDDTGHQHAVDPMRMRAEQALFGARPEKPRAADSADEKGPSRRILESLVVAEDPVRSQDVVGPIDSKVDVYAQPKNDFEEEDSVPPVVRVARRPGRPRKSQAAAPLPAAVVVEPTALLLAEMPAVVDDIAPEPKISVAVSAVAEPAVRKSSTFRNKERKPKLGERWKRNLRWQGGKRS